MRLKLSRSQRTTGVMTKKVLFVLHAKADFSAEEHACIHKYNLSKENIYNSEATRRHAEKAMSGGSGLLRTLASSAMAHMSLTVTINSLAVGQVIECKDLEEMLDAEDAMRTACENLKTYLKIAESFDGEEEVIEF